MDVHKRNIRGIVKPIPAVINCNNPLFLRAENVHNKKVRNGEGMVILRPMVRVWLY